MFPVSDPMAGLTVSGSIRVISAERMASSRDSSGGMSVSMPYTMAAVNASPAPVALTGFSVLCCFRIFSPVLSL